MPTYEYRQSVPNKPIEECKTLSVIVTKDEQAYCWIVYDNPLQRKANLGLSQRELQAKERLNEKLKTIAMQAAKTICHILENGLLNKAFFEQKQVALKRACEILSRCAKLHHEDIWTFQTHYAALKDGNL